MIQSCWLAAISSSRRFLLRSYCFMSSSVYLLRVFRRITYSLQNGRVLDGDFTVILGEVCSVYKMAGVFVWGGL